MRVRFLLDTNAVIAIFNRAAALQTRLVSAPEVFISSVALGELYYVARKSSRVRENLQKLNDLAAKSIVFGCALTTAHG